VPTHAPSPADQLLLACAHALGWSAAPVYWVCDALLIVRQAGGDLDWARLVDNAERLGATPELAAALAYLDEEFALPVPEDAMRRLRDAPLGAAGRFIHRVKTRTAGDPGRVGRLVRLATWRWDVARRLRSRPHSELGAPGGMLGYLKEYWRLPSRAAVIPHLARTALRTMRRPGGIAASASLPRAPRSPARVRVTSPTGPERAQR
jgi:hypothetical protein